MINNYNTMNKKYNPTLSLKKERRKKDMIRSPAFRKKFEDGMPRINHKAIPVHNVYDVPITNVKMAEERGYKFWGCIIKETKKQRKKNSVDENRRSTKTRGQNMLTRYLKRRPSLSLTSYETERRHYQDEVRDKKYETISNFKSIDKNLETTIPKNDDHHDQETFMVTMNDFSHIGNKSLYQMSPEELKMSIAWKKKFLQYFENKLKTAQQTVQDNFRSIQF